MISSVNIQGYRCLNRFEMNGLGTLNLLVGTNNSGKTSVLEAIFLLMSNGDPFSLWQLGWRRGERLLTSVGDREARGFQVEVDVCHLFHRHDAHVGSKFTISARNQTPERQLSFSIVELSAKERSELIGSTDDLSISSRLAIQIKGTPAPISTLVPLSRSGSITADSLTRRRPRRGELPAGPIFVTTSSLPVNEMIEYWNKIALTPAEAFVLRALQFIDSDVERIAVQAATQPVFGDNTRGGFIIKMKDVEQPVPIGSLGDGSWRMLSLAIALSQSRGGVLLIDEIDTGLHYSVMGRMWRLVYGAAKEFNVQVFATTHSYDCVNSLAHICAEADAAHPITVQRIEPGRARAIPYAEDEIKVAADKEIEIRGGSR